MLDVVNLVVGCLAIILSVISIIVSLVYSSKASVTLEKVKEKADAIEKDVHDRLDDLVKRAAPSEQERALAAVMPELFKIILSNPELAKVVFESAIKSREKS